MSMDRRKFLNLGGLGISSFTITGFIPKSIQTLNGKEPIVLNPTDKITVTSLVVVLNPTELIPTPFEF